MEVLPGPESFHAAEPAVIRFKEGEVERISLEGKDAAWMEVVGVAKQGKYYGILEPPMDFIYFPLSQNPEPRMTLIVESYGDPASLAAPLRGMVRSIDANVPIIGVRTMDNLFEQSGVRQLQITSDITGLAACIGLALALFGLYAVVAYQVSRKTREIGIRVAVGADQRGVMKMILRQAAMLSLTGIGIGLVLSLTSSLAFASAANPRAPFRPRRPRPGTSGIDADHSAGGGSSGAARLAG